MQVRKKVRFRFYFCISMKAIRKFCTTHVRLRIY
jgi:hypothetical protein